MICVRKLNNKEVVINVDLIETMEETPDLVITMISGKKYVVGHSKEEVINKVIAYKSRIIDSCRQAEMLLP